MIMQAYLVDATAVMRLVDEVDLDPKSRERARFALTLLVESLAPTNTLAGNPSALAKAVETRGRSLLTGLRHLAGDIRRNGGVPSTVDSRPPSASATTSPPPPVTSCTAPMSSS